MTGDNSSKENREPEDIQAAIEDRTRGVAEPSPKKNTPAEGGNKPDKPADPNAQKIDGTQEGKSGTTDAKPPSATIEADALDDLEDLEFMLEEIESQIAPLAL